MPSNTEIRVEQKRKLFQLMKLKKEIAHDALENLIIEVEAEMEKEDVAWVKEKVGELKTK
jgi:hypothetical protein